MDEKAPTVQDRNQLKRRIILVFACVCILLILAYSAVSIAERMLFGAPQEDHRSSYIFFEADYNENIYDDPVYMDLNRFITFSDGYVSTTLNEGDYAEQDPDLRFMIGYIQSIIAGDAETYNACFSERYYQENKPLDRFTMQKLYNIKLTKIDTQTDGSGDDAYVSCGYEVEYMIHQNNGSFRRDLDSDSIRAQFIVITDREGDWKIDQVITYSYS